MPVRLVDGTVMQTRGTVEGLTQIGAWMAVVEYQVLSLQFDAILGMPWLTQVNPKINWLDKSISV